MGIVHEQGAVRIIYVKFNDENAYYCNAKKVNQNAKKEYERL